jgi:molybdopterin molybdotransferase
VTGFDTFLVVDWSGGSDTGPKPRKDAIWTAMRGTTTQTRYHRNRSVALEWLASTLGEEVAAGRRVLAGFDFPFGYPAGFATAVVGRPDPLALWDWLARELPEPGDRFALAGRLNRLFPGVGPFWFGPAGVADLPRLGRERTDHGLPEKRLAESRARGAFSCWQLGGAGAVGSQALTGMATLARLRARMGDAVAVWALEQRRAAVLLAEVWPSLLSTQVRQAEAAEADAGRTPIRDEVQVRLLADTLAEMQDAGTLSAALEAAEGPHLTEEGWILGVGAEAAMQRAARAALRPDLRPPRLKDDCFALPASVDWMPVDQALGLLRDRLLPVVGRESVPAGEALGRILAEVPHARRANPPGANSAVDGYGFAHATTGPGRMVMPLVGGRAAPGAPFKGEVPPGSALRILTGALLPRGVDTVVLQEDVTVDGGHVAFGGPVKPRVNTRAIGEDVAEGAPVFSIGHRLRPPDLALLAATGVTQATCFAPLRIGVLSTGDEIVPPGSVADPASTFDANRPMLLALASAWGHRALDLGHVRDDRAALSRALDEAATRTDAIFTSGGASAGDEDHVAALLGGSAILWRVAMKPGRPLALGLWRGVPVFGLPGNPVAALVCALIFARPALAVLAGQPWTDPQGFTVPAAFSKRKRPGRREYLRARLDSEGRAEVFGSEGSGRISGLSWATGLVELADGARTIAPGDPVRFLPYSGFGL